MKARRFLLKHCTTLGIVFSLLTTPLFPALAAHTFQYTPSKTSATSSWYSPDWKYRIKLTVNHDQVGEDVVGFPMLVKITNNPALFKNAKADGKDIVFTASDGIRKLDHEIEAYDPDQQELVAWVNVPKLSVTEDTVVYAYYGNPTSEDQQTPTNVWGSYSAVYHLNQDPAGPTKDSSKNQYTGTSSGNMNANDSLKEGKIGKGNNFDGTNDLIDIGKPYLPTFTVSAWVKSPNITANSYKMILGNYDASFTYANISFGIYRSGSSAATRMRAFVQITNDTGGAPTINDTEQLLDNTWYYLTAQYDGHYLRLYRNGVLRDSTATSIVPTQNGSNFKIAAFGDVPIDPNAPTFSGMLDNLTISTNARTGGWVKTEYNNQDSPENFYAISPEETKTTSTLTTPLLFTYSALSGFKEQATKHTGSILYQLSPDNGKTWYYLKNNTTWIKATKEINASSADVVNKYIKDLPTGTNQLKVKTYLLPKDEQPVVLEALTFTYTPGSARAGSTETPSLLKTGLVTRVNEAFHVVYSRIPTFTEWEYWARRVLNKEKKTFEALVGAIGWQKANK